MNGPPPNGSDSIIDIFVLSSSETLAPVLREHLVQNGYHVTLFNNDEHLLQTLKSGKPNLLICDTTDQELPSYDLCRHIKADRDLWIIPVLILTRVTELSDLLFVLDSNADNFISFPYDLPYLISLIGGMLDTPVERPTPEQIKTQFKIQHNDHVFVITADRRKLLEFLLSSFEIAITKHEDLTRAKDRIRLLEESVGNLGSDAAENKRIIFALEEKLELKDQDLSALRTENRQKDQLIAGKTKENETQKQELERTSALLSDTQESLSIQTQEASAAAASFQAEIKTLNETITARAEEADRLGREIGDTKNTLLRVSGHYSEAQKTISDLKVQKDLLERDLTIRTRECDEAKKACEKEKARALAVETEIKSLLASKAEEVATLNRTLGDLESALKQQDSEVENVTGRLAEADSRCANLEDTVVILKDEKGQALAAVAEIKSLLTSKAEEVATLNRTLGDLESVLKQQESEVENVTGRLAEADSRCANLEDTVVILKDEKELALAAVAETKSLLASKEEQEAGFGRTIESLKAALTGRESDLAKMAESLSEAESHNANLEVQISSLENENKHAKAESEKRIDELQEQLADMEIQYSAATAKIEEKDAAFKSLDLGFAAANLERDREKETVRRLTAERDETRIALTEEKLSREAREDEIAELALEKVRISEKVRSLSLTLEEVQLSLAAERDQRRASEEKLGSVIREQASMLESIRGAHDDVKSNLDLHHSDLVQTRRDLDLAIKIKTDLETAVTAAREKIRLLENELQSVSSGHTKAGLQVRSLGDELEQTKTALETERRLRHVAEESLHSAIAAHERSGQDIGRLINERGSLNAAIESEQKSRQEAEHARDAARKDLASTCEKLEETKRQEAVRAEQQDRQILALTQDLESIQAEHRMREELIRTLRMEKEAAEKIAGSLSAEIEQARVALADEWEDHMTDHEQLVVAAELREQQQKQAIIVKGPDLPMVTRPTTPPMIVPEVQETDRPVITGVEDLFEDAEPEQDKNETGPQSPILAGPVDVKAAHSLPEPGVSVPDPGEDENENAAGYDQGYEAETDEDQNEQPDEVPARTRGTGINTGVSFNRAQWFDLLRWSHHSGALTQEQRMQIVRMGRLIQRGRKLTARQEEQVVEMITLAQALGYRFTS